MRACDQRGLSTQQLIKFCSNLFETLHGYYQHKEDFFSTRVGGGGGGTHLKWVRWGALIPIILEVGGQFVLFIGCQLDDP